jgi:hypothetical protein
MVPVIITSLTPSNHRLQEQAMKPPLRGTKHIKNTGIDYLLVNTEPRYIESQIIDYIMSLREKHVSYATMLFLITPIFTFYQLNDVMLNRKKSI